MSAIKSHYEKIYWWRFLDNEELSQQIEKMNEEFKTHIDRAQILADEMAKIKEAMDLEFEQRIKI